MYTPAICNINMGTLLSDATTNLNQNTEPFVESTYMGHAWDDSYQAIYKLTDRIK